MQVHIQDDRYYRCDQCPRKYTWLKRSSMRQRCVDSSASEGGRINGDGIRIDEMRLSDAAIARGTTGRQDTWHGETIARELGSDGGCGARRNCCTRVARRDDCMRTVKRSQTSCFAMTVGMRRGAATIAETIAPRSPVSEGGLLDICGSVHNASTYPR